MNTETNWISVKKRMPDTDKRVLASFIGYNNNRYITIAFYVPEKTKEDDGDYEGDCIYDENDDQYYWPEGWYEVQYESDINFHIEKQITHWMPLPQHPED